MRYKKSLLIILPLVMLKATLLSGNNYTKLKENTFTKPLINDTTTGQLLIKVIETGGTSLVKYVGWTKGDDFIEGKLKLNNRHEVECSDDGYFRIDSFNIRRNNLVRQFDYLFLYDADKKQIGHIVYHYSPEKERPFIRQLILFFHTGKLDCYDDLNRMQYPYSEENPYYASLFGGQWTYFNKGEYPVTMLIPPDYSENGKMPWKGNKFPQSYEKIPVLFVHGLTGKYIPYNKADVEKNETSYWWMQVKYLNTSGFFDGWQVYYPYDANIDFIARWLKADVEYIYQLYQKELNMVTHSMGGLVTTELITSPYFDARKMINKVFLSEPPLHGSLGGNKQYRTSAGRFFQLLGFDREAPSIRDLSFGSDFYYNLHSRKWPSLDEDDLLYDDYFVLAGTTQQKYKLPAVIHREADGQSDGIVAVSSASLLDHQIGFATFNGNHDDGRGCWSSLNFDASDSFLSDLIVNFFTKDITGFNLYISENQLIDAYYKYPENKLIEKRKREGVDLKQGIFSIRLQKDKDGNWNSEINKFDELIVLRNKANNTLVLSPRIGGGKKDEKFIESNGLNEIIENYPTPVGYLNKNTYVSDNYLSYYFTKNPGQDDNCAVDLREGFYNVIFYFPEKKFALPLGKFKFEYLKTHLVEFDLNGKNSPFFEMAQINTFTNYFKPAKLKTDASFVVDTSVVIEANTKTAIFQLSCPEAYKRNIKPHLEVKNPNGFVLNSKIASVTWGYDKHAGYQYYVVDNPTPGKWKIAAKAYNPGSKKLYYSIFIHTSDFSVTSKRDKKNGRKADKNNDKTKSGAR